MLMIRSAGASFVLHEYLIYMLLIDLLVMGLLLVAQLHSFIDHTIYAGLQKHVLGFCLKF